MSKRSLDLATENRELKEKLRLIQTNLAEKNQAMKDLQDQHNILKLARNMEEGSSLENAEELKKKINKYIREIDQCLKLIGD